MDGLTGIKVSPKAENKKENQPKPLIRKSQTQTTAQSEALVLSQDSITFHFTA
jgi:hypothetical protein